MADQLWLYRRHRWPRRHSWRVIDDAETVRILLERDDVQVLRLPPLDTLEREKADRG